jgi:hypothetical protein
MQTSQEKADFYYNISRRLVEHFFPMVQDPKILLAALENLNFAIKHKMTAALEAKGRETGENFEEIMNAYSELRTSREELKLIHELWELSYLHSVSPIEFSRKDEFVICLDDYKIRKISAPLMKKYLSRVALFLRESSDERKPKRILK